MPSCRLSASRLRVRESDVDLGRDSVCDGPKSRPSPGLSIQPNADLNLILTPVLMAAPSLTLTLNP